MVFFARDSQGVNYYFEAESRAAVQRYFKRTHGSIPIRVRKATETEVASLRLGFKQIVRCDR